MITNGQYKLAPLSDCSNFWCFKFDIAKLASVALTAWLIGSQDFFHLGKKKTPRLMDSDNDDGDYVYVYSVL